MSVVHCKQEPFDVYIGRPAKGQPWGFGNPFVIGQDGERDEVISKFARWLTDGKTFDNLDATPERRQWILDNVKNLKGKTLGCWCSPNRCHGDVLSRAANIVIKYADTKEVLEIGRRIALKYDKTFRALAESEKKERENND